MTLTQLPDKLIQGIVLLSGGSWGDAAFEDRQFFRRFAAVVAAHEREQCAKICDALAVDPKYASQTSKLAAMAIRDRD
jgi:hypothetical protein